MLTIFLDALDLWIKLNISRQRSTRNIIWKKNAVRVFTRLLIWKGVSYLEGMIWKGISIYLLRFAWVSIENKNKLNWKVIFGAAVFTEIKRSGVIGHISDIIGSMCDIYIYIYTFFGRFFSKIFPLKKLVAFTDESSG